MILNSDIYVSLHLTKNFLFCVLKSLICKIVAFFVGWSGVTIMANKYVQSTCICKCKCKYKRKCKCKFVLINVNNVPYQILV